MPSTIDPVCGRRVDPQLAWERKLAVGYRGHVYYFCSAVCALEFALHRRVYALPADVVCGRKVAVEKAEADGCYSDFEGIRYYFCSLKCYRQFLQTPSFYHDLQEFRTARSGLVSMMPSGLSHFG